MMFLASTPRKCMTRTVPRRKGRGEGGETLEPRLLSFSSPSVWGWDIRKQPWTASSGSARKHEGPGRSAHRRGGGGSRLAGGGDGDGDGDGGGDGERPGRAAEAGTAVLRHLIRTSRGGGDPQLESKLSQYLGSS